MERNDYKNKYLKYKQKYTNVLENMYGGNPSLNQTVSEALNTQPKAIYIVDKATYNNVRILLSLGEETSKTINRHTNCIDMLIGISNRNVLKIIPMATIYEYSNVAYDGDTSGRYTGYTRGYTRGLQKIDGTKATYFKEREIQFTRDKNYLRNLYFGKDSETSLYSAETARNHLLNAKSYFESCGLSSPYLILLSPDNTLHFYGTLYT
jgi:hypothetical protein